MKWTEIRVTTSPEAGDAVAGLFHRLGCAGVAVDDPAWVLEHIRRGDWDAWELEAEALRPGQVTVTGYVAHGGSDASAWLQQELRRSGVDFRLQVRVVDEESWAEAWKRYYHAVPVGRRLLVRPSWEREVSDQGRLVVELDPGMAFGTGTHASTRVCMEMLEDVLRGGETVVDIGTGSGILALAAARLGAARVVALDNEEVAARVAAENAARNGVSDVVEVYWQDAREGLTVTGDVVVANLTADLVLELLPVLAGAVHPGGYLLVSGIIGEREAEVAGALAASGLSLASRRQEQDWVGLCARRVA